MSSIKGSSKSFKLAKQRVPWPYRNMLNWYDDNGVVKAFPNRKLTVKAHETILWAFQKQGGGYVVGGYFELVLSEKKVVVSKTLAGDIHGEIGNVLAHVTEAARELAREG